MNTIKNVSPLNAEALVDLLKKEFADYINDKLGSNLSIEYAHVSDIINIIFPEIVEGNLFTLIVSDKEISLTTNITDGEYKTETLEEQLIAFLNEKCS